MARIGIVTTHPSHFTAADPDRDSAPLVAALRERGAEADSLVWRDEDVDWAGYDLLVLRSPWDWVEQPAAFAAWLDRVGALTTVLNPPALVRWNMDKRYLEELGAAGVAVVPTVFAEGEDALTAALDAADTEHVVLKPVIGAGSAQTGLFRRDDPAALALGREILAGGGTVMVQPEVPELSESREKALYTIDGAFTHAVAKGALLARGGGLRGGVYQENPQLVPVSEHERRFAEHTLATIAQVSGEERPPLYARIDTVDSAAHGLVLLEAELFEPTYNLHLVPEVVEEFAAAILARA